MSADRLDPTVTAIQAMSNIGTAVRGMDTAGLEAMHTVLSNMGSYVYAELCKRYEARDADAVGRALEVVS